MRKFLENQPLHGRGIVHRSSPPVIHRPGVGSGEPLPRAIEEAESLVDFDSPHDIDANRKVKKLV
ncbi:hypothetical protein C7B61_13040 [filamentous cyanobacterium CCP1]|nr:hypothetical protein C7B76_13130 [filamentous cyanobacterium CCP2]PSB63707.1 hypothetical protein C7B61_13040 [filamentous cyanobacterium CCP1]